MKIIHRLAKFFMVGATAAMFALPASAQFQPNSPVRVSTFSASGVNITSAASATDLFSLSGSATKLVTVTQVDCSGLATTAGVANLALIKRSTANTGGTSTTPAPTPFDSTSPAATAVMRAYTVNPTLGSVVGTIGVKTLGLPLASGVDTPDTMWTFATDQSYSKPIVLRGVAQSLVVNGIGATLAPGATASCTFTWTES